MRAREARARFAQQLHAARRQRIVRAAREVALFHADVVEHAFGDRDVLRLAAVRRAGQRELVVAPVQRVEPARLEQRHHLERLGARPPRADELRRMRAGDERVVGADDRRVYAVARFDFRAASRDYVQLERFHAIEWRHVGVGGDARIGAATASAVLET